MKIIRIDKHSLAPTLVLMIIVFITVSCAALHPRNPIPENMISKAEIPGLDSVRFMPGRRFVDETKDYNKELKRFVLHSRRAAAKEFECCERDLTILSLSGGGENGAFGAGILIGWTASGSRPEFDIVTGISTGALQAPFAFLGPAYDSSLAVYSTITAKDIFKKRPFGTILQQRDAVADFTPLENLIEGLFGEAELREVARQHARGRLLIIGTTLLDAQLLVFWNMGAIASSGHPDALNLFRKVMIASASIPVAVPPVYIDVEAEGKTYDEMHVDGGVMTQVFGIKFLKYSADAWRKAGYTVNGRVYIIRNARLDPEWREVDPKLVSIGGRSTSTMIKSQGIGDLYRAYVDANDANFDFNYIDIPSDFKQLSEEPFDPKYMKALYDFGFQRARKGLRWNKFPPYFTPLTN